MPDKKLTDSEIVKALEDCLKNECDKCFLKDSETCQIDLMKLLFDLINRLQAENERLEGCVKTEDEVREIAKRTMEPLVKEITKEQIDIAVKLAKAEACKEFANWQEIKLANNPNISTVALQSIIKTNNDLLKELVGEDNASKD